MWGQGGGSSTGYDTPEQYVKWAWGNKLGGAPPIVQWLRQQPGMQSGSQFNMVGGYTPEFAAAINQMLFPNVRPGFDIQGSIPQGPQIGANALANLQSLLPQGNGYSYGQGMNNDMAKVQYSPQQLAYLQSLQRR